MIHQSLKKVTTKAQYSTHTGLHNSSVHCVPAKEKKWSRT